MKKFTLCSLVFRSLLWGAGCGLITWFTLLHTSDIDPLSVLVALIIAYTVWGAAVFRG